MKSLEKDHENKIAQGNCMTDYTGFEQQGYRIYDRIT